MNARDRRVLIQKLLGVTADGIIGRQTRAAFDRLAKAPAAAEWPPVQTPTPPPPATGERRVLASSFADPADIRAFKRCKQQGKTDLQCFKVGDNGIGKWGDDTTADRPMCALPREDWAPFGNAARGKLVRVRANGREVLCELRDTMPARKNIKNGAGIDLNPAAVKALGLTPPIKVPATWSWA